MIRNYQEAITAKVVLVLIDGGKTSQEAASIEAENRNSLKTVFENAWQACLQSQEVCNIVAEVEAYSEAFLELEAYTQENLL